MSVQMPGYNPYTFSTMSSTTPAPASSSSDTDKADNENKTDGTDKTGQNLDAVFGDESDKKVSMDDFLSLMVAQLKNQDFMNPVDDTQYVTQLAQISTMQQMEEMAYNAKSTYVSSLVGKTVTAAKFTVSGDLKKTEGVVNKISLLDEKFVIYVDGEAYDMDEIMEVKDPTYVDKNNKDENNNDNKDGNDGEENGPDKV